MSIPVSREENVLDRIDARRFARRRRQINSVFAGLDPAGRHLARDEYRLLRSYGLSRNCARGSFVRIATLARDFPATAAPPAVSDAPARSTRTAAGRSADVQRRSGGSASGGGGL